MDESTLINWLKLGQHLLNISFSSVCHQNSMREGGHYSLFIINEMMMDTQNLNKVRLSCPIDLALINSTSKALVPAVQC